MKQEIWHEYIDQKKKKTKQKTTKQLVITHYLKSSVFTKLLLKFAEKN